MHCSNCQKNLGVLRYQGTLTNEYCSYACYEQQELSRSRYVSTTEDYMIEKKKKTTPDNAAPAAPKKNKMATPEEPTTKKKKVAEDTAPEEPTTKKKKVTSIDEVAPKKKKDAAPEEPAPKKKKAPVLEDDADIDPPGDAGDDTESAPEPKAKKVKKAPEDTAKPKKGPAKDKSAAIPATQTKVKDGHANPYRPGTLFAEVFARLSHGKKHTIEKLFEGLTAGDPRRVLSNMKDRGDSTEAFSLTRNQDKTYTLAILAAK